MPHILYNIKISILGWPFHAMLISFFHIHLHYPCSMYGGIIILNQIIVIWEMTCNNGPNKVINITVNNCQSLWCSPRSSNLHEHHDLDSGMVESILRRVVAKWVHGCPFPILPYIQSLYITFLQKSFTVLCLFNLHHASRFWHCCRDFWCFFFTTHMWYFASYNFLWTVWSDTGRALYSLITFWSGADYSKLPVSFQRHLLGQYFNAI